MHTKSSQLFRAARIPSHEMNVYARFMVSMYFAGRYGHRVKNHSRRIAVALERMDG